MLHALEAVGLVYAAIGALVAALVLGGLAARFDPAARGAGWGFRLVVLPGTVLLWPFVLRNAVRGEGPADRTAHDDVARTEPRP